MTAWLTQNMVIVHFVYGLSFFSLGLVITAQYWSRSRYHMAQGLWALAAFAFIHAFAVWGLVFIPLQAQPDQSRTVATLWGLRTVLTAVSFGFLLHFGIQLLEPRQPSAPHPPLRGIAPGVTILWLLSFFGYPLLRHETDINTWYWVSEVWSRYMIGLPAGVLVAMGLVRQRAELRSERLHVYIPTLYASAAFYALYGLTTGLVVPRQEFWPASVINSEAFFTAVGIPVEIFSITASAGAAICTARLMRIFKLETDRRLYQSEEERAIFRERERIARDLHDGMLQTLYGIGLGLRNLGGNLPPDSQHLRPLIRDLIDQLGGAIVDLRRAITDLRDDVLRAADLIPAVRECANQITRLSGMDVSLEVEGFDEEEQGSRPIPASFRDHVLALLREGLSNAARHAYTNRVEAMLALQDDTLILRIVDRGVGFDPYEVLLPGNECQPVHHGLRNMTSRAEQLGGTFRIDSAPGRGTRLLFYLPLPRPESDSATTEGGADG